MPKIRTIFQPDTVREVDEHEAAQLRREGLLLELEEPEVAPPTETAAAAAAPKTVPAPVPTPAKEATPDGDKQAQ